MALAARRPQSLDVAPGHRRGVDAGPRRKPISCEKNRFNAGHRPKLPELHGDYSKGGRYNSTRFGGWVARDAEDGPMKIAV